MSEYFSEVLRLIELTAGDMSEPKDPEAAVLRLRAQLDAAGKATALLLARITRLEGELKEIRPARESLRECLGAFTEVSPGWYQSAYVPAADFRGWQADAGL